jgi:SAM-dependent methyltransferase
VRNSFGGEMDDNSKIVPSLLRLVVLICMACFLTPGLVNLAGHFGMGLTQPDPLRYTAFTILIAVAATPCIYYGLKKLSPFIDAHAEAEAEFLDKLDFRYLDTAIAGSAALSLFLELAIIRWQSSVLQFFAFYKNFSLLACFIGLGLGYALATRNRIPLLLVIPLLAWQFTFMIVVRFGLGQAAILRTLPFREQLSMGVTIGGVWQIVALYSLLAIVFLLTALTFLPIGQLCGRLMERRSKLRAYGLNLLGSLVGVLTMIVASFLWTPPLVWFAICFLAILLFHLRRPSMMVGAGAVVVCCIVLAWPVEPLSDRVYSPYQLLEIGSDFNTGLTQIRAAGEYYQRIFDLSRDKISAKTAKVREYYDLPYKAHPHLANVAVVGAGTGNDVAAAVRAGAGYVDAIEIDPAILLAGRTSHPEHPYQNPRVHTTVNDARSFLRNTTHSYDLIVYGLLDSHTLLSQGSSVRLDSFVYTVEGLREARRRLKPEGVISLSFAILTESLGRKIYVMLQQVFDGRPPICVEGGYDGSITFLESNDPHWTLPAGSLSETGFRETSAQYSNNALQVDPSTDDWPFFYMPRRVYPTSYLAMIVQVLVLSLFLIGNFVDEKPSFSHLSFFFLGVGFMLIETKGITEMGLAFGNTWLVIGVVIAGILVMAWLGNCAVQWLNIQRPHGPYLFLWAALAVGWFIARGGGLPSTPLGRLETVIVLTCPLLFSGIVFSTLLAGKGAVSGKMAMNLLGAICGGLLEYNSMYFGFRSLYLVAMGCYLGAFISDLVMSRQKAPAPLESIAART